MHSLTISLRRDEIRQNLAIQLTALNRAGDVIARSGTTVQGFQECELLPLVSAAVTYAFLYADAKLATVQAIADLREQLRALRRRERLGRG